MTHLPWRVSSEHLLTRPRPNAGGSCISVSDAVAGWKNYIQPFTNSNPVMYLGSPAVTNAAFTPTTGLGWLKSFMDQCNGCNIDFINIHWYDSASNVQNFKGPYR
jgi:hypothetical protein